MAASTSNTDCTICHSELGRNDSLKCDLCGEIYCETCSGLTSMEVRALNIQKRTLLFYCSHCKSPQPSNVSMPIMQHFAKMVVDLKQEVNALKDVLNINIYKSGTSTANKERNENETQNIHFVSDQQGEHIYLPVKNYYKDKFTVVHHYLPFKTINESITDVQHLINGRTVKINDFFIISLGGNEFNPNVAVYNMLKLLETLKDYRIILLPIFDNKYLNDKLLYNNLMTFIKSCLKFQKITCVEPSPEPILDRLFPIVDVIIDSNVRIPPTVIKVERNVSPIRSLFNLDFKMPPPKIEKIEIEEDKEIEQLLETNPDQQIKPEEIQKGLEQIQKTKVGQRIDSDQETEPSEEIEEWGIGRIHRTESQKIEHSKEMKQKQNIAPDYEIESVQKKIKVEVIEHEEMEAGQENYSSQEIEQNVKSDDQTQINHIIIKFNLPQPIKIEKLLPNELE